MCYPTSYPLFLAFTAIITFGNHALLVTDLQSVSSDSGRLVVKADRTVQYLPVYQMETPSTPPRPPLIIPQAARNKSLMTGMMPFLTRLHLSWNGLPLSIPQSPTPHRAPLCLLGNRSYRRHSISLLLPPSSCYCRIPHGSLPKLISGRLPLRRLLLRLLLSLRFLLLVANPAPV